MEQPSMRIRRLILLGLASLGLGLPGRADAGPVLSFGSPSYTILDIGQTVQVQVFLAQTAGGIQIGPTNALLTAGIQLSFNNPSGVAAVLSTGAITPGPAFNSSSAGVTPTQATLAETSISPSGIGSLPVLLGTFTFTGLQSGPTQISVAAIGPGSSFSTTGGDVFIPTPATASMNVLPAPSSSVIALTGVPLLIGGLALRRRRPRASPAP
jgi:hypothetical protein